VRQLTVGSLFTGIGGFDLGLERAGMRVIWQAEIDPYACAVLKKHWPHVPNLGDVRKIARRIYDCEAENEDGDVICPRCNVEFGECDCIGTDQLIDEYGAPDLICGGFPCQDISIAGRGDGLRGTRSGLWSEFDRIVGELRPRIALVENVGALTSRGLAEILGDFAAQRYDAEWHVIPAAAVDAPHLRERVWIIASDADSGRCEVERESQHGTEQGASRCEPDGLESAGWRSGQTAADATRERMERDRAARLKITYAPILARLLGRNNAGEYWRDWPTEPALCRSDDGPAHWVHRMRVLGSAVVPQVVEVIGRAIVEECASRIEDSTP
jgi:DNA (cytosine-5)-methyltransferase 1